MTAFYEEIQNIAVYLILVTVLLNLVHGSSYKKYVNLVCGMVLVLIVLSPITRILSLDSSFSYHFNFSNFKLEAMEKGAFSRSSVFDGEDLEKAEEVQKRQIQEEYKKILTEMAASIVEEHGRKLEKADIVLEEEDYGTIEELAVEIAKESQTYEDGTALENSRIEPVRIDKVAISNEDGDKRESQEVTKEGNPDIEAIEQALSEKFAIEEGRVTVYEKGE